MKLWISSFLLLFLTTSSFGYQLFTFKVKHGMKNESVTVAKVTPKTLWFLPRAEIIKQSARCVTVAPKNSVYLSIRVRFWSKIAFNAASLYVRRKLYGMKLVLPSVSSISFNGLGNLADTVSNQPIVVRNIGHLRESRELFLLMLPKGRSRLVYSRCTTIVQYLKGSVRNFQGIGARFEFDPRGLPNYSPKPMQVSFSTSEIANVAKSISSIYKLSALMSPRRFSFYASDSTITLMALRLAELKISFLKAAKEDVPFSGDTHSLAFALRKELFMDAQYFRKNMDNVIGHAIPRTLVYKIRFLPIRLRIGAGSPMLFHDVDLQ